MDSTITRFRFRDSTNGETDSGDSSVSSTGDDDSKLESMSAKGIKRLCSELLELKKASEEDFHQTIYLNYSAFIRIFEKVGGLENELLQLKHHLGSQRKLVKDLANGIYLEMLSKESIESIIEESLDVIPHMSDLEAHMDDISETFDILLLEHRLDEAMDIIEMETQTLTMIQLEEDPLAHNFMSAISEMRARLADQLASVADNERVAAAEFQKALSGLCELGDSDRALQLLLKFYRSRIRKGLRDLQSSKTLLHDMYIWEVAKFVFSVISQAAMTFVILYGEKTPYASELIQWAHEETEVFVCCFSKYVKSISEINGGLSTTVEAAQCAISYCSILETQRIVLCPFLVKSIHPCMEEVLKMHIDHFKKVIGIFTATDTWVLCKYLVSGLLKGEASPMIVGHKMEYCRLTNSGRKFVTSLQATMKEISPLIILQMDTSILNGLIDLFRGYIANLERAIPSKENIVDKNSPRVILAQTLSQQLSILANSSAVLRVVSATARSIFKNIKIPEGHRITNNAMITLRKELDSWIFSIQDVENQLRSFFYQQFISRIMCPEGVLNLSLEVYLTDWGDSDTYDLMPSETFQVLFMELRKLDNIGKDVFIDEDWLLEELLRELMETIITWISNNEDFWTNVEDTSVVKCSHGFEQFVLDMHFLVEMARFGGYLSDKLIEACSNLMSRVEAALPNAELDAYRDVLADEWAKNAATQAIDKLLEIEKGDKDGPTSTSEQNSKGEQYENDRDSVDDAQESVDDDAQESLEDVTEVETRQAPSTSETSATMEKEVENSETATHEKLCIANKENDLDLDGSKSSTDWSVQSEDVGAVVLNADDTTKEKSKDLENKRSPSFRTPLDIVHGVSDQHDDYARGYRWGEDAGSVKLYKYGSVLIERIHKIEN